jgi:hypothetical protein
MGMRFGEREAQIAQRSIYTQKKRSDDGFRFLAPREPEYSSRYENIGLKGPSQKRQCNIPK